MKSISVIDKQFTLVDAATREGIFCLIATSLMMPSVLNACSKNEFIVISYKHGMDIHVTNQEAKKVFVMIMSLIVVQACIDAS